MLPVYFGQNDIIHTVAGSPSGRHKADVVIEDYQGKFNFATPSFPSLDAAYLAGVGYKFNLRNLFRNYAGFSLPLPSNNQLLPESVKGNIVKIKVRVQSVGTIALYENISNIFAILNGGMSESDFAKLGNHFFETWSQVKGPFLTWQPKTKRIEKQSPEHLYWLQNIVDTEITITVRYSVTRLSMGVTSTSIFDKILAVKAYQMACIPVRPEIIRTFDDNIDPISIRNITVQVLYAATSYASEIRDFKVFDTAKGAGYPFAMAANSDTPIYLKILNSFGVWDTIRFYGKIKTSTETERYTVSYERRMSLLDIEGFDLLEVNTGSLDQDWLRYMKQLLYARKIYHLTPTGNRELMLETKTLPTFESSAIDENANFEFRYVEQNSNYSNL